jgi:hypothetical protein
MKKRSVIIGVVVALLVLIGGGIVCVHALANQRVPHGAMTACPSGEGWMDLLAKADAWKNCSDDKVGVFEIKDGMFHIFGGSTSRYIAYTAETFGDFALHVEFKLKKGTNSGVFFRTDPKNPVQGGFEIQVLDDAGKAPDKNSSGSLYDVATPMFNMAFPAGEWNSYDIQCQGSHLVVDVNGWKVIDLDLAKMTEPIGKFDTPLAKLPQTGNIVLQDHEGEIWYRNVKIKKL